MRDLQAGPFLVRTGEHFEASNGKFIHQNRFKADVTPRRVQAFKLSSGDHLAWSNSAGGTGTAVVDAWGLVTVAGAVIKPNQASVLALVKQ